MAGIHTSTDQKWFSSKYFDQQFKKLIFCEEHFSFSFIYTILLITIYGLSVCDGQLDQDIISISSGPYNEAMRVQNIMLKYRDSLPSDISDAVQF